MKKKLTITVDELLIPEAKRFAARHDVSLSSLVENSLRRLVESEGGGRGGFAERWRGRFEAACRDDERYRILAERYL